MTAAVETIQSMHGPRTIVKVGPREWAATCVPCGTEAARGNVRRDVVAAARLYSPKHGLKHLQKGLP